MAKIYGHTMSRDVFIRPTYVKNHDAVLPEYYTLATTNGTIEVDEQVLEHFTHDYTGREIAESAVEFGYVYARGNVLWGKPIYA